MGIVIEEFPEDRPARHRKSTLEHSRADIANARAAYADNRNCRWRRPGRERADRVARVQHGLVLHCLEELVIRLRLPEFIKQEVDSI